MEPTCLKTNFICFCERNSCGFHDNNLFVSKNNFIVHCKIHSYGGLNRSSNILHIYIYLYTAYYISIIHLFFI